MLMPLRAYSRAVFLASLFAALSEASASGIPVVDAAALTQALQTYVQLGRQYETLVSQYNEQVKAYKSMNGSRMLGKLLWSPELRSLLPADYQRALDAAAASGRAGLSGEALALFNRYGMDAACGALSGAARAACEKEAAAAAQTGALFASAGRSIEARSRSIEELMAAINNAQDPKAIADLGARINAETAALTAERIRLQSLEAAAAESQRLLALEAKAEAARRFAPRPNWKTHLE